MTQLSSQPPTRNEIVAVGLTSIRIAEMGLSSQNKRTMIIIRNTSPNVADIITIKQSFERATANEGVVLRQNEAFVDSTSEGYECYQGTVQAICATANGQLSIMER